MKTAVIYARYSSERQTEQSIDGQLRACNDYAERNDILVVDTYIDRAMTGTNDNRTQFQKMLRDSTKKAWDVVLVYKLDRFSRNKYEIATHRKTLRDNKVKLVSAMENIPDTPEGIILESLLEGMAEYYSAELSQKVKRGMKESRQKGNHTGGYVLYGYKIENKKIIIDEPQAEIIRFIFSQYATGTIVKDITKMLNEKGILHRGKPFPRNTIYDMLKNEKYLGICHHGAEEYTNIYPQIISKPIWNIIRKKTQENKIGKQSIEVVYLLRNKMICGYCGRPVSAETGTARGGNVERYYKCIGRKHGSSCKKSTIKKDILENLVVDTTCQILNDPATINMVADKILDAHQKRLKDQSIMRILLKEQSDVAKSINNIMSAIEKGIITNSTKQRLDELETLREEIAAKITVEQTKQTIQLTKEEIIRYIKTALKQEPKQMIDLLIQQIVLYDDKIEIYYKYTHSKNPDDNHRDFSFWTGSTRSDLVPVIGLEPIRYHYHWILSPARLPISPHRLTNSVATSRNGVVYSYISRELFYYKYFTPMLSSAFIAFSTSAVLKIISALLSLVTDE